MKICRMTTLLVIAGLSIGAAPEVRQKSARAEEFDKLLACRNVGEAAARLACYDQNANALGELKDQDQIVVIDRKTIKETRRGLFGFTLPKLGFLNSDPSDEEDIPEMHGTIKSARLYARGQWEFTLEDGAVWRQIDTNMIPLRPREGMAVTIKRAALGSYKASFASQPAIRVRREM
jgi:hypothetical protein